MNQINQETEQKTELEGEAGNDDTGKNADNKKKEKKKKTLGEEIASWILYLLAAVVIAGTIRGLLAEPIRVNGRSMLDTLHDGDYVLVTKPRMLTKNFKRGDVVICHYPGRTTGTVRIGATLTLTNHEAFVKRLVALPGDSVAIVNGQLVVNDQVVREDYITHLPTTDFPRTVLREGQYFVIGDNRSNSHDSRSYDVGPLSEKMIVGHAAFVLLPFSHFGPVR